MSHDKYISPFETRYASPEMQYIFSEAGGRGLMRPARPL